MQLFKAISAHRNANRRRTGLEKHLLRAFRGENEKTRNLEPGMTETERASVLQADPELAATILNACGRNTPALNAALTASIELQAKMRIVEASELNSLDREHQKLTRQYRAETSGGDWTHSGRSSLDQPTLYSNLDRAKTGIDDIRRRAHSLKHRAIGMGALGVLLLSGDLALLYAMFVLILSNSGEDLVSQLAAAVSTLIVALLLLLFTHLGLSPLVRLLVLLVYGDEEGGTAQRPTPAALFVMVTNVALAVCVSFSVALIRAAFVVDGPTNGFIALNTAGLPVLSLFIELCFTSAYSLWRDYRSLNEQSFDVRKDQQEAALQQMRLAIGIRRAAPIARAVQRTEKAHSRLVRVIHDKLKGDAFLRNEANRLASMITVADTPEHIDETFVHVPSRPTTYVRNRQHLAVAEDNENPYTTSGKGQRQ